MISSRSVRRFFVAYFCVYGTWQWFLLSYVLDLGSRLGENHPSDEPWQSTLSRWRVRRVASFTVDQYICDAFCLLLITLLRCVPNARGRSVS